MKEKRFHKIELPLWGSFLLAVLLAGCIMGALSVLGVSAFGAVAA